MNRKIENASFTCEFCTRNVHPSTNGSYRNHCPFCLYSKHVDVIPGDRASTCGGLMEPIGLKYRSGKGYQIVHKCIRCGVVTVNIIATDTVQPDDIDELAKLCPQ
jgi:hypothetical protein